MDRIDAGETDGAGWTEAVERARGLLLALAVVPVAGLAGAPGARGTILAQLLGATVAAPAFFFLSGILLREAVVDASPRPLLRALARIALCAALAALVAAALGLATAADWRAGLARIEPALRIVALPAAYVVVARLMRRTPALMIVLALAAHVYGVILADPAPAQFVYFAGGLLLAARRAQFERLVAEEAHLAAASLPFVVALALVACARAAGHAGSVADVGPIALALGLAAGPAALASAAALADEDAGAVMARLGRAAPFVAIVWLPLFFGLLAAANRGAPPSPASLALFALASLLAVAFAVDAAHGSREPAAKTQAR